MIETIFLSIYAVLLGAVLTFVIHGILCGANLKRVEVSPLRKEE